jgi:hypothetical protein
MQTERLRTRASCHVRWARFPGSVACGGDPRAEDDPGTAGDSPSARHSWLWILPWGLQARHFAYADDDNSGEIGIEEFEQLVRALDVPHVLTGAERRKQQARDTRSCLAGCLLPEL